MSAFLVAGRLTVLLPSFAVLAACATESSWPLKPYYRHVSNGLMTEACVLQISCQKAAEQICPQGYELIDVVYKDPLDPFPPDSFSSPRWIIQCY